MTRRVVTNGIDLSTEIEGSKPDQADQAELTQDQVVLEQIAMAMDSLQDSFSSMHIFVRTLSQRMASIEKHVAFLLQKDPEVGEKIKEHLKAMDAEKASGQPE